MLRSLFNRLGLYFIGLVGAKAITTVLFILLARRFTPEVFGDIVFYWMLVNLTTSFADFGMVQWYQKKADKTIDKRLLLHSTLSSRTITYFVSLIITLFFLIFFDLFSVESIFLFVITLFPEAILSVLDGYYFERKQSTKVAQRKIIQNGLAIIGYLALWNLLNFQTVLYIILLSSIVTCVWYFPWKAMARFSIVPLRETIKNLRASSNYAFLIVTSYAYARGDSIIIRLIKGPAELGFYGGAYRYLESLALLPTALQHNLFPLSAQKGTITIKHLRKIILAMTVFGLFVSVSLYLTSNFLITGLLGPAYQSAVIPLQIFSLVLFLFFINSPLATVVQSSDLVGRFLPWGVGNTVLNIVLNVVFVPNFGIVAAALSMLVTEITGLIINLLFIKKIYSK